MKKAKQKTAPKKATTKKVAKKSAKKLATKKSAKKLATKKATPKKEVKEEVKKEVINTAKELIFSVIDNYPHLIIYPADLLAAVWKKQLKSFKLKEESLSAKEMFNLIVSKKLISPSTIERCRTFYMSNSAKSTKGGNFISHHPAFTNAA